ncbi:MAG: LptA/OstA family protein [Gammaproteobacteria bacterium]
MERINPYMAVLFTLLLCNLWITPALAANKSQSIYIVSDSLRIEDKKGISHFNGRVRFKQGNLVIRADSILTRANNGNIDKITINGSPIKLQYAVSQTLYI